MAEKYIKENNEKLKKRALGVFMFPNLIKPKPAQNSKLSDFVLNSSSSEKKRIYSQVIERAISSQVQVVNKASATQR